MPTWISRFLFLALAWSFISAVIAFEEHDNHLAVVHIINSLTNNSEPVSVFCISRGRKDFLGEYTLKVGEDFQWDVTLNTLNYGRALWGRVFASWHAFQPRRDVSHGTVYWQIRQDGFFLSWDNSSWVKREMWETE